MRPWTRLLDLLTGTTEDETNPGVVPQTVRLEPAPEPRSPWSYAYPRDQADVAPGRRMDGTLSEERDWAPDSTISGSSLASSIRYDPVGTVIPPPSALTYWRDYGFDTKTLSRASPVKLMEIMADISPDVSRALWDYLRFSIHGYTIKAYTIDRETPNKAAQIALNNITASLAKRNGSLDILFGRFFMGAFVRGAFFSERVFAKDNRTLIDILAPDPVTVRFRRVADENGIQIFQLGQLDAKGQFIPLDTDRVVYMPVDPFPGSPYGRSPINPAIFSVIFLLALLNDIKRVVMQQGYPRIDIEVDLKELAQILPEESMEDPDVFTRWVNAVIKDVKTAYAKLQPESAFVHTSLVKLHSNVGTLDVNSLGMVGAIIERLEGMALKGLKSMPLLMGKTDGMSEANANREWEVYVEGIKNLQHHCENMLSAHLQAALEATGVAARVEVRFAELRTSELLRDEMTRQLKIANSLSEYLVGAADFKTMVHNITGDTPPAGVTEPLLIPSNFISFGAANATKNVNATEDPNSADPSQAGGDSKNNKDAGATNDVGSLVTREIEDYMRRSVKAAAGFPAMNGNGTHG